MPPILPPGPVGEARRVTLRKINRRAPRFIQNLVRSRMIGHQVEVGQRVIVFEVVETDPEGAVEVTAATVIEIID